MDSPGGYWFHIFERAILLSRFGRQTANNFAHRATRSKMGRVQNHSPVLGLWSGPIFRLCEVCEVLRSPYVVKRDTG